MMQPRLFFTCVFAASGVLAACASATSTGSGDEGPDSGASALGGAGATPGASTGGVPSSGGSPAHPSGGSGGGDGLPTTGGSAATTGGVGGAEGGGPGDTAEAGADPPGDVGLIGWASVSGDGVPTTTGGRDGAVVTPASAEELVELAQSAEPLVIQIAGTFDVPRLDVASDKTLVGISPDALIAGGVRIRGEDADTPVTNVIVQNLRIDGRTSDADGDAMHIYYAHHVWVDHCEIFDAPDGNLDIVHASNWVTVSFTKFRYSADAPDPEHRFSNLIGHTDDNAGEDAGRLKVTFHHDWWAEGVVERMPRVRFGDVHVFNCYFSSSGNNYAVGAGYESRLLIENNCFEGVNDPHVFYDDEPTAEIAQSGNVYENTSGGADEGQGASFDPPYDYALDTADAVRDAVSASAGPQ